MKRLLSLALAAFLITSAFTGIGTAQAAPATGTIIVVLTSMNEVITVQQGTDGPQNGAEVQLMGLDADEYLLAIDFRPANGRLYGISNLSQLYVIDYLTGWSTKVGSPLTPALEGAATGLGFDFNPAVDRIRIVTGAGQDLRIHPDTGELVATDGRIRYAPANASGANPRITASAYANPDNSPATGTTLYNIDASRNALVTQNPPNDGVLNLVGPLGISGANIVAFDISQRGEALAVMRQTATTSPELYTIDLTSGKATWAGTLFVRDVVGMSVYNTAANPNAVFGRP